MRRGSWSRRRSRCATLTGVRRDVAAFLGSRAARSGAGCRRPTLGRDDDVASWLATTRRRRSVAVRGGELGRVPPAVRRLRGTGPAAVRRVGVLRRRWGARLRRPGRARARRPAGRRRRPGVGLLLGDQRDHRRRPAAAARPVRGALGRRAAGRGAVHEPPAAGGRRRPEPPAGGAAGVGAGRDAAAAVGAGRRAGAAVRRQLGAWSRSRPGPGRGGCSRWRCRRGWCRTPSRWWRPGSRWSTTTGRSRGARSSAAIGLRADHPRWLARVLVTESELLWPDVSWAAGTVDLPDPALPDLAARSAGRRRRQDLWSAVVPEDFWDAGWVPGDEDPGDGVQCLGEVDDVGLVRGPRPLRAGAARPRRRRDRPADVLRPGLRGARRAARPAGPVSPAAPGLDGLALDPRVPADLRRIVAQPGGSRHLRRPAARPHGAARRAARADPPRDPGVALGLRLTPRRRLPPVAGRGATRRPARRA